MTAHSLLAEADLHESKGASVAAINTVAVANGAGAAVFGKLPTQGLSGIVGNGTSGQRVAVDGAGGFKLESGDHGDTYFVNLGAPYVLAALVTFSKAAPATTGSGHPSNFTESANGRLTYTGTDSEHFEVDAIISLDQASGAARDVSIAIAKNGTVIALSEQVSTTTSGVKTSLHSHTSVQLTTNDYIEAFVKISTAGNVSIYCYTLSSILL